MPAGAGGPIGAAWSDMLGDFEAGAFMLVLRPFEVGEFVDIGGVTGTLREPGPCGTTLVTPDNEMTLVDNGWLFGDAVQNYSALPARRAERIAQPAGGVDPIDAIARITTAVALIPSVSTTPAPEIKLLDMNLVGTVIGVRPYTHTDHGRQVYFDPVKPSCASARKPAGRPHADAEHEDDPGLRQGMHPVMLANADITAAWSQTKDSRPFSPSTSSR